MGTNRRLGPVLVLQWMWMKHPASPDDARAAISWICPSWFRSINWFPRIALRRIVRRKRLHSSGLPCTSIQVRLSGATNEAVSSKTVSLLRTAWRMITLAGRVLSVPRALLHLTKVRELALGVRDHFTLFGRQYFGKPIRMAVEKVRELERHRRQFAGRRGSTPCRSGPASRDIDWFSLTQEEWPTVGKAHEPFFDPSVHWSHSPSALTRTLW